MALTGELFEEQVFAGVVSKLNRNYVRISSVRGQHLDRRISSIQMLPPKPVGLFPYIVMRRPESWPPL